MVSTAWKGKTNIITMSWHMMIDFEPPLIACVVSTRNYSFEILKKTKECVINIPAVKLASQVVAVGNSSGARIFQSSALTKCSCFEECFANIDRKMSSKYNIFILEVVQAWITPSKKSQRMIHHYGNGNFVVDGKQFKLFSRKK